MKIRLLLTAISISFLSACVHTMENSAEEEMLLKAHSEIKLIE